MAELLFGCGNNRVKRLRVINEDWSDLVTLDNDPNCGADVEHDLERMPYPFPDEKFDEIHAYHVLEHTGAQGDWRFFFAQWEEFYRLLKPNGMFCGIVPAPSSAWVWGDPGHKRVIQPETFVFLNQPQYTAQVGKTAMCDYRRVFRGDFDLTMSSIQGDEFFFGLRAVKPSRIST